MRNLSADMTPEGWNDVATAYDEGITPFTRKYAEDALRVAAVRSGERVLDIAAGGGALSLLAARAGAQVTATDFSRGMVDRLRERAKQEGLEGRVKADVMDAQALTLPDASFDAAFCVFGIMFVPDRELAYREIHRVLKPGGRVAVTTWAAPDRQEFFAYFGPAMKAVAPDLPHPPKPPTPFTVADPRLLERELAGAGFRGVQVQPASHAWEAPSPEALWDTIQGTNPVFPALAAQVGAERVPKLRERFVGGLREAFGSGPVRLKSEALLTTGVK